MSKIFESFVKYRISKYLDGTGLFSDILYGFRAYISTADLLMVLGECIYNFLYVVCESSTISLDLWKAFAEAWHGGILHKLKAYSVRDTIRSIVCFLQDQAINSGG